MQKLVIFDWEGTLSDTRRLWTVPDSTVQAESSPEPRFFYPGILAQLQTLQAQGFLLAVATGKSTASLAECLKHPALQGMFASTRTAEQTALKPEPQMLQEILLELHCSPRHSVMVGDSVDDIRMARRCGLRAIAVQWEQRRSAVFDQAPPDALLHDIADLAPRIGALWT